MITKSRQRSTRPRHLLLVDDDKKVLESLRLILAHEYHLTTCTSGEKAIELLKHNPYDLALLDITLQDKFDGFSVLRFIIEHRLSTPVIVISAADSAEQAVRALKLGARHYMTKPVSPDNLSDYVAGLLNQNSSSSKIIPPLTQAGQLIGKSMAIQSVLAMVNKVSESDATIYLRGESGTGKEMVAQLIHQQSKRSGPFVAVNCAAIPDNLLESVLFGHQKGAFTGADQTQPGKIELANNGTLFLDEIASLKSDMQGKLLRVLQEREIERLGESKPRPVDIRVIAASNQDLKVAVAENRFREDLYYRVNVVPIVLPTLAGRREDIPLLVDHFIQKSNKRFNRSVQSISKELEVLLSRYPWPGNVRELENLVERMVILSESEILTERDLPFEFCTTEPDPIDVSGGSLKKQTLDFERQLVVAALKKAKGNQSEASTLLGVHRNTLINKMEKLGVDRETY